MLALLILIIFVNRSLQLSGALAKNPLLLGMFDNTVVEEVMQLRSGEVLVDGDGEVDEHFEEVNACDSRTSYILPRAARSVKGSFMFIVNQPAQEKLKSGWKELYLC